MELDTNKVVNYIYNRDVRSFEKGQRVWIVEYEDHCLIKLRLAWIEESYNEQTKKYQVKADGTDNDLILEVDPTDVHPSLELAWETLRFRLWT